VIDVRAIRSAIADVLEGRSGVRGVEADVFLRGVHDGKPVGAQQALAMIGPHRFDVGLNNDRENGAAFPGAFASQSLVDMDVTIRIFTHVATSAQDCDRDEVLAKILADGRIAVNALRVPGNLLTDADGNATAIASGLLQGPSKVGAPTHRITSEDWDTQLIKSEISGLITLTVEANAA
jgi:hypothetical protein